MTQTEAVTPVISGPSQADGIARFALRTKYEDLTAERRERLKVGMLDAVACAINALGAPPIEACRAGPRYVVEGAHGLAQLLGEPIRIDWERVKLDAFDRLALKSYNTAVPGQASVHCMLELRKAHVIDPAQIDSIENDTFQDAYDFMGGASFGPKTDVHTKEQADHSLPYLLAVALLDGSVQPAQLTAERIAKPDAQRLLRKVKVAFPQLPRHRVNVFEPIADSHKWSDSRSLTSSAYDVDCRSTRCN